VSAESLFNFQDNFRLLEFIHVGAYLHYDSREDRSRISPRGTLACRPLCWREFRGSALCVEGVGCLHT